jgi:diguanylate cyclase (GGDEF)-like protein/PAS domain S-box-containing protein
MNNFTLDEQERLDVLRSYEILDTPPEADFDRLAALAMRICEVPIATVTLVDEGRQWFKSVIGLHMRETDRAIAFCAHAIRSSNLFVVQDASTDPLFADNPLVVGESGVRFYAGMPLISPSGFILGAFAIMDRVPRRLTDAQIDVLETLSEQVMMQLELRRQRRALEKISRKYAQSNNELLQKSRALLQIASEIAHIGGWEVDLSSDRVMWSDEVCKIHGMPLGTSPTVEEAINFYAPEWRDMIRKAFDTCVRHGTPFDLELEILTPDGNRVWVRSIGRPVHDADGLVMRVQGAFQDITEKKETEKTILQSRQSFRQLADAMPQIVWTAEPDGMIDYISQATNIYAGLPITDDPGERWLNTLHPDDQEKTLTIWGECVRAGRSYSAEFRVRCHDGCYRWHLSNATPIKDKCGKIVKWYGACTDIHDRKVAEDEAREIAARLQKTLESITDAFFTVDRGWRFSYLNKEAQRLLKRTASELLGKIIWDEFKEAVGTAFYNEYHRALRDNCTVTFEEFYAPLNLWLEIRAYPFDEGLAVYFRDITNRKCTEHQLKLAGTAFEHMAEGLVIIDSQARIMSVNPAFTRMTGYTPEEAIGHTPRALLHDSTGHHDDAFFQQIANAVNNGNLWEGEIWCRRKNGDIFPQLLSLATMHDPAGQIVNHIAVFNDITKQKEHEARLEFIAHRDSLTQLPNRQLLLDRLQHALAASARSENSGALLFIDLDNFKILNDSLGHDMGDLLLQQVALRLQLCVRESDTVARLGGDEFVIIVEDLSEDVKEAATQVKNVGEKILVSLGQPYQIAGHARYITASIGVALYTGNQSAEGELLKRADLAMYQAKAAGRNAMRFFDPEMQAAVTFRVALEVDLRRALEREEFLLHYQPLMNKDGSALGAEALLRWRHPERGFIPPAEFISVAEDTGLILPLGQWVMKAACAQLVTWATMPEMAQFSIAVNVSARQFHHPDFVEQVLAVLDETAADPRKLKLELTESLLVDDMEDAIAKMTALKDRGVGFSLDDFGTGYSSLSYLKRLPLDQLKIDRSFVKDVLTDPNDAVIACMIMALGQSLGLTVIAEGVETEAQRSFLARHGCHAYQGYLFSKPLPACQVTAFLKDNGGNNKDFLR